jgi:hypothetical protein
MPERVIKTPLLVKILSILLFLFGIFAFVGSVFLWGQGFILAAPPGADLSYPIPDILVNAPASITAAIGLWKRKQYGYVAAQFTAGFYIYASIEIFVKLATSPGPLALEILIPQVLAVIVALMLVFYLWPMRRLFFEKG